MRDKTTGKTEAVELRRRAENQLSAREKKNDAIPASDDTKLRLLHELQVHRIQLEMQNAELAEFRNRTQVLLEKFTDLYDFSPVGYLTLDGAGRIREVNLTGAAMLGIARSFLLNRRFSSFVVTGNQTQFTEFSESVFANADKQICELELIDEAGVTSWVDLQGACHPPEADNSPRWCRSAVSDISARKRAAEAKTRLVALQRQCRRCKRKSLRERRRKKLSGVAKKN